MADYSQCFLNRSVSSWSNEDNAVSVMNIFLLFIFKVLFRLWFLVESKCSKYIYPHYSCHITTRDLKPEVWVT